MPNPTPAPRRSWQATLIISLFIVAVAAAAAAGWRYARESPPHQGPIVLVSVDALRADRLPAYGSARRETPAIDALTADGVVFEHAYTHSPQTLPAHASMLTGQLPFEHGVRDEGGFALADQARTIAEMLRNRGFATGGAVSSFVLRRASGAAQGFSFYDAELPDGPADEDAVVQRDGVRTFEAAESWIRMQSGQRYFLFLEVDQRSADAVVGRLVDELKSRGLYDNATIVFTSGHGDPDSGASLDDSSLRVPLIVKQPDGEGAGRHVAVAVQHIDLVPTLLDLVRAPLPSGLRGRSLRPILDGKATTIPDQPIYSESLEALFRFDGQGIFAVTSGGYRLVRGPREDLRRIVEDAGAGEAPAEAKADQLRGLLDRLLQARTIQTPSDIADADADRFAAIGYVPGLRAAMAVTPPPVPTTPPSAIPPVAVDSARQAAVTEAHRMAVSRVAARQYLAAVAALRAIVRAQPELAAVHFQIGSLLARAGKLTDAIAAYEATSALRPDAPDVAIQLAATLLRARRVEEAKGQAERAVMLANMSDAPRRAAAHEIAARVALAGKDSEAANAHALEAQRADPARPLPQWVRGQLLYDEGKYEDALAAFQEADKVLSERGGALADLQLSLGDALARLDRYPEAETHYREELRAFPENIRAYSSLAMLYRASNREQAMEQTIGDLVVAAPTAEGYSMAVKLWTIVGERARADALRADARRRFRGDPSLALFMH